MIRRSVLLDHQVQYKQGADTSEDYVLYVDLHNKTKLANLQEVLLHYRLHEFNVSKTNREGQQQIIDAKRKDYVARFFDEPDHAHSVQRVEDHFQICSKPLESASDFSDLMKWLVFLQSVNDRRGIFKTDSFLRGIAHFLYRKVIVDGRTDWRTLSSWIFTYGQFFNALPGWYKVLFVVRSLSPLPK